MAKSSRKQDYDVTTLSGTSTNDQTQNKTRLLTYFSQQIGEDRTSPLAHTKLFVVGRGDDGKEEFLNLVFGAEELEEENGWDERVLRGHFDAKTFKRVRVQDNPTLLNPRFVLWDYTWKPEYSFAEHLFLTQQTVYVVLFDARCFLKDEEKQGVINYLRLFLGSKRIHGHNSQGLLFGTHCAELSSSEIAEISGMIQKQVLVGNGFKISFNNILSFYATDGNGLGRDLVKKTITTTILARAHIKERVPFFIRDAYRIVMSEGIRGYLTTSQYRKLFPSVKLKSYEINSALQLMSILSLVLYYKGVEELEKCVIYRPEFILRAVKVILYKDGAGYDISFDSKFSNKFIRFNVNKVLEDSFLEHVWMKLGFKKAIIKYLKRLMLYTNMIADYNFDTVESYLVPAFYPSDGSSIVDEDFKGARFVIDFSGKNNPAFSSRRYLHYLPNGFYEKLVVLCLQLSASCRGTSRPIVEYRRAQISFGGVLVFMLNLVEDTKGKADWIECKVIPTAKWHHVNGILKRIFLMVNGLKRDFFHGDSFELATTVLLASSKESGKKLAEYTAVRRHINEEKDTQIQTVGEGFEFIDAKEYKQWFSMAEGQNFKYFEPQETVDYDPEQQKIKDLPEGMKYHCFLSYKATTASPEVKKQYDLLKKLGYLCFLDTEVGQELNSKTYLNSVAKSVCFILVLSKDVFEAPLIIKELRLALEEKKKIIFLHHPNTGRMGYLQYGDYAKTAPEDLKELLQTADTFQLETRFYLQESVTNYLDRAISTELKRHN